jgi:hypothetical protein
MAHYDFDTIDRLFQEQLDSYTHGRAEELITANPIIRQTIFDLVHDFNNDVGVDNGGLSGDAVLVRLCDVIATERSNGLGDEDALNIAKAALAIVENDDGFHLDVDLVGEGAGPGHDLAVEAFEGVDSGEIEHGDGDHNGPDGGEPHGHGGDPHDHDHGIEHGDIAG